MNSIMCVVHYPLAERLLKTLMRKQQKMEESELKVVKSLRLCEK